MLPNFTPISAFVGGCTVSFACALLLHQTGRWTGGSGCFRDILKKPRGKESAWKATWIAGCMTGWVAVSSVFCFWILVLVFYFYKERSGNWKLPTKKNYYNTIYQALETLSLFRDLKLGVRSSSVVILRSYHHCALSFGKLPYIIIRMSK